VDLRPIYLAAVAVALSCVVAPLAIVGLARNPTAKPAITTSVPDPAVDVPLSTSGGSETMVVAGGCFWGVQAVFQHVNGVISATSGYAGGTANTAQYEVVSSGRTGHAESVKVTYDPSKVSYGQLLKIFFSVAHDPTQLNEQGPDVGPQYRSVVFAADDTQRRIARGYIDQLDAAKVFRRRIVTDVASSQKFYEAEAYHQDYFTRHPYDPYILMNDRPKVEALRRQFPDRYLDRK
jgi:peptide-methionine (S)-S-oxide reductase